MVVNSENKAFAYDNLSQEFAASSSTMTLQQPQQVVPLQELPEFTFSSLTKQNSILSLTLDEFQCKSGKSFGSMSMDEFLASIWNSDDNNQFSLPNTHDAAGTTSQSKSVVATEQVIIPHQGTFSVPPPICKKTVDEVWCEIQQPRHNEANNIGRNDRTLKRQRTLGEMTLEDFLVKAGVVQEPSSLPRIAMPFQNRPLGASYGFRPEMGVGFCTQQNVGSHDELATYQMLSQNNSSVVRGQNTSRAIEKCRGVPESSGSNGRKRIIDSPPELAVERRQRRMLKNRESAARSRARRQAYTVELEAELGILKQENDKLKEILSEAERKRKQEIFHRKQSTQAQKRTEKMRAIRRSVSTAW
ncbi:putative transcription factor bZIP family [Lupinus albus]|uniref:Putative transcription factor bZIP family n=1 Tax=Lupinus albus TaxID=3870 RepID=A0A6A4MXI6_LUPAL|nr:putative transcription factor bZIP family [Lupinus albus]